MNVNRGSIIINLITLIIVIGVFVEVIFPMVYKDNNIEKSKMVRVQSDLSTIKKALELYNEENAEVYPAIDKVTTVFKGYGIVWSEDASGIVDPWDNAYEYATSLNRKDFIIMSKGPDGILGNNDDIYVTNSQGPTIGKPPAVGMDNKNQWTADRSKSFLNNNLYFYY